MGPLVASLLMYVYSTLVPWQSKKQLLVDHPPAQTTLPWYIASAALLAGLERSCHKLSKISYAYMVVPFPFLSHLQSTLSSPAEQPVHSRHI